MHCPPQEKQVAGRKAKKRFSAARQRLDWRSGVVVGFVVMDDIRAEVAAQRGCHGGDSEHEATRAWDTECFEPDLYAVEGEDLMAAEVCQKWLGQRCTRESCLQNLRLTGGRRQEPGDRRQETGDGRREAGGGRQEAGGRRQETGGRSN